MLPLLVPLSLWEERAVEEPLELLPLLPLPVLPPPLVVLVAKAELAEEGKERLR